MISRFSAVVAPSPEGAFFQQAIFQHRLGQCFLQLGGLAAQFLDLIGGRLTGGIAGQALLASFQKLLRPALIQVLVDAFLAAQFGDARYFDLAPTRGPPIVQ